MITIYGKLGCPPCITAQRLCREAGVPYEYKQLNDDPAYVTEFFSKLPSATSVPQAFYGDKHIGGIVKLRFELESIKALLSANPTLSDSDAINTAINDSDVGLSEWEDEYMKGLLFGKGEKYDKMDPELLKDSDGDGHLDSDSSS